MVLYVSPYVNHKIKYSKETIWLKLENTGMHTLVVIYMYIWNLIITATCCFPGKLYCFKSSRKFIQHAVSKWKWRGGGGSDVPNWTILRKYEASLYFLFYINLKIDIFLDIGTSFFDLKKSISWYQKIDSWYQEIIFIFLYQEIGLIFLYQKSKYRMNSITAPQYAVLLFIRYFFYSWYKKKINLSFWYKISARFFLNQEFHILI